MEVVGELNPAELHLKQCGTPTCGKLGPPSSSVIEFEPRCPVRQWRIARQAGPNPPCGTSSSWWVILPWRLGAVHEFTGTWTGKTNSGLRHEKAADAGLGTNNNDDTWQECRK